MFLPHCENTPALVFLHAPWSDFTCLTCFYTCENIPDTSVFTPKGVFTRAKTLQGVKTLSVFTGGGCFTLIMLESGLCKDIGVRGEGAASAERHFVSKGSLARACASVVDGSCESPISVVRDAWILVAGNRRIPGNHTVS